MDLRWGKIKVEAYTIPNVHGNFPPAVEVHVLSVPENQVVAHPNFTGHGNLKPGILVVS